MFSLYNEIPIYFVFSISAGYLQIYPKSVISKLGSQLLELCQISFKVICK